MDEIKELLNGGPLAQIGALVTFFTGAILAYRKFFRQDQVQGASTEAQLDIIAQLRMSLKDERDRADMERKRADDAFQARNDALAAVARLEAQVSVLQAKVDALTEALKRNGNTT